jgi:aminopeptidase N
MVRLQDYRPSNFAIDDISLSIELDPTATHVHATYAIRRLRGEPCPLVLDGVNLTLARVALDGKVLEREVYQLDPEQLIIPQTPASFTLETETLINPDANTALEGLYMSGGRFCTQCEAQGFRRITYALDRPDVLSRFTVRLEADKRYPTLLSNGNLKEMGLCGENRHFAVWCDPYPKPSYLFAVVAGSFDSVQGEFVTASGRTVALTIHVDEGDSSRAIYALDALKRAMAWDERVFQREYDLSEFHIVAVRDFNAGAMENKGLNIFTSTRVLADFETATDEDFEDVERVIGHEYFHNWTGNRITLRDWFQLCLKEGLTVYRDQEFSADQRSRAVKRIKEVKILRESQFAEDSSPLAHAVRPQEYEKIDNFYTMTVYRKGAEVVRMLETLIGRPAFDRGMQLYFNRWDGHAVTVEEFLSCFEEESGQDLRSFFRWYTQAGTPHVTSRGAYEAETGTYRLTVSQQTPDTSGQGQKQPLTIPLRIGLIDYDGAPLPVRLSTAESFATEWNLALDNASETFVFEGVTSPPIPAILRAFSAPVMLDDDLDHRGRLVQMAFDPDPITRWEAGRNLLVAAILSDARGTSETGPPVDQIAAAFAREMDQRESDLCFVAMAMSIPNLAELILCGDIPDVEKLFCSRNNVRRKIARVLETRLVTWAEQESERTPSQTLQEVGRRAVKAEALNLLASLGASHANRIASAFERSNNMTDTMGALGALSQMEGEWFDESLNSFLGRWRQQPRVVDKWFAVQAQSDRDDALGRVRMLAQHELFSPRNPNRVRSLYGALGTANLRTFHARDGSGYAFLCEGIQLVDALNPSVAARLVRAFESWKRLEAANQIAVRSLLERLLEGTVSKNVKEMVERVLR